MNDLLFNLDSYFHSEYEIIQGDTLENLKNFESEKFDLIVTSPPYNVGKEYEIKQSIDKYLEQQEEVIR